MRPHISVVVPTWSRPRRLERCLHGLAGSEMSREDFEVVVVDDGGQPPAAHVVERWSDALSLRLVRQPNQGPGIARDSGVAVAAASRIAFVDDDCVAAPDWLPTLLAALERHPGALVGGRTLALGGRRARASQVVADALGRREPFFATNNLALDRDAFESLGGFDARFSLPSGEDLDFCRRWAAAGRSMHREPAAVVRHAPADGFTKQHFRYGRGAFKLSSVHGPVRPDAALQLLRGALELTTAEPLPDRPVIASLVVWSQVAAAAGWMYQAALL